MVKHTEPLPEQMEEAGEMLGAGDARGAFLMYRVAAKEGDADAQINLGYCYDTGTGTRRSASNAIYWYRQAHSAGHYGAAHNIASAYRDQGAVHLAVRWFQRAIADGVESARIELGKLYLDKLHVRKRAALEFRKLLRDAHSDEEERLEARALLARCRQKSHPVSS